MTETNLIFQLKRKISLSAGDTQQQKDSDRRMSAHIFFLPKGCWVPPQHQFFWHLETNLALWQQHRGMPVAIPTIISAVATSAPVGNLGVPCEEIREEQWCSLNIHRAKAEKAAGGAAVRRVRAHTHWSGNFLKNIQSNLITRSRKYTLWS